ncbi:MAG: uroporphyrinogen-III decarboxylase-like protein [Anaerolineae bacterium]|nr:uroporphyrinogen-III decarboxylase-like protein [Anaerolineae bacterium]
MKLTIDPEPDFNRLRRALLRQGEPERVSLLELFADPEIIRAALDIIGGPATRAGDTDAQNWMRQVVHFWHRLGYDAVWMNPGPTLEFEQVSTADTAPLPHEQRNWHRANVGIIQNWADFERYPWPRAEDADFSLIEFTARMLPDGMKIFVNVGGMLEPLMWLMAYEPFAIALYEDPALIEALVDKIAGIFTPVAEIALDMDFVGGLFIGDDMGFKTATMVAPEHLQRYVFPYHKRLAAMAHARDKIYLLHACGNLEVVMDDLIDDVKIDAKHSYEDTIMPVEEAKARYGDRVGIIGGIDVDFLCRAAEDQVRARTRDVLDKCMPGGGYVLGSGNSVANYIPVQNFLAMVDEGHKWRPA